MNNILVTGCAGFIGFSLAKRLLKNKSINIIGFDNLNEYYSIKLKKKRLSILQSQKNFTFFKIDLLDKKKLDKLFNTYDFKTVFHLAAQAGVRYVKTYPEKFIDSNITGFHNLIEASKESNISKFFYASSSSVYGDAKKFPVNENSKLFPKNIYGLSKKINEEYININSNKDTCYIGLRFFTVYGEWGRPDMLILKFLENVKKNKTFMLNNSGNHWRDFTYIDDVVSILVKLLNKRIANKSVYNICGNKPIYIKKLMNFLTKKTLFDKIKNVSKNEIEVKTTHGDNSKIKKKLNLKKFTNIYDKLEDIIKWHEDYNHLI